MQLEDIMKMQAVISAGTDYDLIRYAEIEDEYCSSLNWCRCGKPICSGYFYQAARVKGISESADASASERSLKVCVNRCVYILL